jgi:hypothetical protein
VLVAIGRFVRSLTEPAAMTGVPVPAPARRPLDPVTALTSYQREVLEWLAQGPSNKEIAGLLGVICQIQQMPVNKLSLAAAGGQPGILRQTFN